MEENVFGSLDEIDASLDAEFGKTTDEPETVENETTVETETEGEPEKVEEPEVEQEEVVNQPKEDEGDKENKKDHAFADLRAQNGELRRERDGYKADSDYLKELAASYGYTDLSQFQDAIREARYQKEAKDGGYDPALYKKTMEQERRIEQLEKEKEAERTQRQLDKFQTALSAASNSYNVDEQEILERLEEEGVTVEEILSSNNHKLLINGVLVDEIKNSAKQKEIENLQNLKDLAEDKNEQGGAAKTVTIESLLKDDLAKYKQDNFF